MSTVNYEFVIARSTADWIQNWENGFDFLSIVKIKNRVDSKELFEYATSSDTYLLAILKLYGDGCQQDYEFTFKYLFKNQGYKNATFYLALMYDLGLYINKDSVTANALYEKASEDGSCVAEYNLAQNIQNGIGALPNFDMAISKYKLLADKKYTPAIRTLGILSLKTDFKYALKLLEIAANNFDGISCVNLAIIYSEFSPFSNFQNSDFLRSIYYLYFGALLQEEKAYKISYDLIKKANSVLDFTITYILSNLFYPIVGFPMLETASRCFQGTYDKHSGKLMSNDDISKSFKIISKIQGSNDEFNFTQKSDIPQHKEIVERFISIANKNYEKHVQNFETLLLRINTHDFVDEIFDQIESLVSIYGE